MFYALLAETGVLLAGAPPILKATRMAGQRTPAELVGKYGLHSQAMRELLTSYLAERAAELDYASLAGMANTLCGLFWRDLEEHHPGIASLHLDTGVATAWKERLRQVRDQDGRLIGDRATARSQLLIVRAFYLDIAQWAAEDPSRWARWAAPCPIKASECSMDKERKRLKAAMDQRTRARLPVLPALVRTADQEREATRARLDAALPAAPGQAFDVHGEKLQRRNAVAGRIYVTDLATGRRRDLTFEEERAFWGWATIEILRATGVRVEELVELSHHSFVAYKLPSTGEIVPMLQIAPSKTDTERLLLVSPELGEVLAEIIHRVRGGRATLPLVSAYDPYERTWSAPMPSCSSGPAARKTGRYPAPPCASSSSTSWPSPGSPTPRAGRWGSRPTTSAGSSRPKPSAPASRRTSPPRSSGMPISEPRWIRRDLLRRRRRPPPGLHRPPARPPPRRGIPRSDPRRMGPIPAPLRTPEGRSWDLHQGLWHAVCS